MTEHLTETQVSLFRERVLGPTERKRIDSHIAECESCLRRILPSDDTALVYNELTEALLPDSADEPFHLSNAEIRPYANGSIDQADRVIFESHFDICDQCSEAVQSLATRSPAESVSSSARKAEIPAPQFTPACGAAVQLTPARAAAGVLVAACLVLAFVLWLRWHSRAVDQTPQQATSQPPSNTPGSGSPTPAQKESTKDSTADQFAVAASLEDNGRKVQLDSSGKLIGLEELPEASRSLVRGVLANKTLSKPEVLAKLTTPSIT